MNQGLLIPPGFANIGASIRTAENKVEMMNETFALAATEMREATYAIQMEAQAIKDRADNQAEQTRYDAYGSMTQGIITIGGEAASYGLERSSNPSIKEAKGDLASAKAWSDAINKAEEKPAENVLYSDSDGAIKARFASEKMEKAPDANAVSNLRRLKEIDSEAYGKFVDRIHANVNGKEQRLDSLRNQQARMGQRIEGFTIQGLSPAVKSAFGLTIAAKQEEGAAYDQAKEYATLMLELSKGLYNELIQAANRMSNDINSTNEALINRTLQAGNAR